MADNVVKVTDQTFEQTIQSDKPVLVDFWAEWCGPCKMMAPVLDELAADYQGKLTVAKLNVDENPAASQKFGIMSIPTLLLFKNGQVVKTFVGYMSKKDLADKLADSI
ncbi:thioredoxin TrxA [Effusibacillus lacus]|uniref:Thioredoxin n=1 Tax=Effusibacillus lacus TaxID=1348429 RepID=A0A292YM19_9BACL|nr:thioredoxin TrxA [Effusibacillus lacus]TCS71419.1 thioredoxin [Effusibacillus lacus]GAX89949.1 thiol reductase thioredoxin [Effusibacillus lacus]